MPGRAPAPTPSPGDADARTGEIEDAGEAPAYDVSYPHETAWDDVREAGSPIVETGWSSGAARGAVVDRPAAGRTVIDAPTPPRPRRRVPGAVKGLAIGAQAAAFAYLITVVPVVAIFALSGDVPRLGDATWLDAAAVGGDLFLLANGATLDYGSAVFSIMPLGASLVAGWGCAFSVRHSRLSGWREWLAVIVGYLLVVALVGLAATRGAVLPPAMAGATVIAGLGLLAGLRRKPGFETVRDTLATRFAVARATLRAGLLAAVSLLAAGGALTAIAIAASAESVADLTHEIATGAFDTIALTGVEAALVPDMAVWAGAYAAGPGFAVGSAVYTAGGVASAALPAVPVLGALPVAAMPPWSVWALIALPIAAGAIATVSLIRAAMDALWWRLLGQIAGAAVLAGAVWAALAWAASGAAGPLDQVGPDWRATALAVGCETALGGLAVAACWILFRWWRR